MNSEQKIEQALQSANTWKEAVKNLCEVIKMIDEKKVFVPIFGGKVLTTFFGTDRITIAIVGKGLKTFKIVNCEPCPETMGCAFIALPDIKRKGGKKQ